MILLKNMYFYFCTLTEENSSEQLCQSDFFFFKPESIYVLGRTSYMDFTAAVGL